MWTVGLTVEIKLCFRDGLVWTVDLTVEIKLRFLDGLVWTVGLSVEIKLCFLNSSCVVCGHVARLVQFCKFKLYVLKLPFFNFL